jgi:hypothetical protein
MDDQGRQVKYRDFSGIYSFNESVVSKDVLLIMQGELVRLFANDQNKIRCDTEMQTEIDTYISRGQASFNVQLLVSFKITS